MNHRNVDPAQRRIEIGVAVLFLLTALTSITGEVLLAPHLKPALLADLYSHQGEVVTGALLWSINNIGIVFIAVFLHPFLAARSRFAADGYLATRIVEGTVMMVGILALLLLVPMSAGFVQAGAPASWYTGVAELLGAAKVLGITTLSLPLLGLGGLLFTRVLWKWRLVPLAISLTGLVGYTLVLLGGVLGWYGLLDTTPFGAGSFLAVPVAVFEILLLPPWLLIKGFKVLPLPGVSQ